VSPFLVGICILTVSGDAVPLTSPSSQTLIERVSVADLDLRGEAGRATLQRRIHGAARRVCATQGVLPLAMNLSAMRCTRTAIARASAQLDQIAAAHAAEAVEIAALAVDTGR
jgi:UrcA family protein